MEFLRERVYTSLNADELKAGDKVIVAYTLYGLKEQVKMFTESAIDVIEVIQDEDYFNRFKIKHGESFPLAYLVERAENCTNCEHLGETCNSLEDDKITYCGDYKPNLNVCVDNRFEIIAEARKHIIEATNIEHSPDEMKVLDTFLFRCWQMGWLRQYEKAEQIEPKTEPKTEKHYRPFKDVDELIKVWCNKCPAHNHRERGLTMPLIWVRRDSTSERCLIVSYTNDSVYLGHRAVSLHELWEHFTFLDGSVCGVEE